jgi:hypothetical protein
MRATYIGAIEMGCIELDVVCSRDFCLIVVRQLTLQLIIDSLDLVLSPTGTCTS